MCLFYNSAPGLLIILFVQPLQRGLEVIRSKPILKQGVAPVSIKHPQAAILDFVPPQMVSLQGPIVSGVDIARVNMRTKVAFRATSVDESSDMTGCLGEGMPGVRLGFHYFLAKGDPAVADVLKFSDDENDQTDLEVMVAERFGAVPMMSMIGSGDHAVEKIRQLLLDYGSLSQEARYNPRIVGEAISPNGSRTDGDYLRFLDRVRPFEEVKVDQERALDPEMLSRRAHLFYSDELGRVSDQLEGVQEEGRDLRLEAAIRQLEESEGTDGAAPFTLIARYLVGGAVERRSLADVLAGFDRRLFERLVEARVLRPDLLRKENEVNAEQLMALRRPWQLEDHEIFYLVDLVNGRAFDMDQAEPLLRKIAGLVRGQREEREKGHFYSRFPDMPADALFYKRKGAAQYEVPIYRLGTVNNGRLYRGLSPVFRDIFASAGIDIRPLRERLDELGETIWPQLERSGALNKEALASFDVFDRDSFTPLMAAPWNLGEVEIEAVCAWLNGRNDQVNQEVLQRVLLNLYSRYEELTGRPAVLVVDLHADKDMSEEDRRFLEITNSRPRQLAQPLGVSAIPFPGENTGVGLDVLKTKLEEAFEGTTKMSAESLSALQNWATMIGRHPEYEKSLEILKSVAQNILKFEEEDGFLASVYFMAEDRKSEGKVAELGDEVFVLLALLPGFIEQGRRAAADANVEAANYSYQLVRYVTDYLLQAMTEDGFGEGETVARLLGSYNDDALMLLVDYYMAEGRSKGGDPVRRSYQAIKDYLRLVGAHKVARLPQNKREKSPDEPPVAGDVGSAIVMPETGPEQTGPLARLRAWWRRVFLSKESSPEPVKQSVLSGESVGGKPEIDPVVVLLTPPAPGIPWDQFASICSVFERGGSFHSLRTISPLAESPAVLYALAERLYCQGNDNDYKQVIELARRVYYGYGNLEYGRTFADTLTACDPHRFSDQQVLSVENFAPISRFGDRYYLEIVRLGLQSSYRVLRAQLKIRQRALRLGRTEGPEFEQFAEAEQAYREMHGKYHLLAKSLPSELSPFRQFNAEANQGMVAVEVDRDFDMAQHYFDRAANLVFDHAGNPIPGRELNARRIDHLRAELDRQWVDFYFWEQSAHMYPVEQVGQALTRLGRSLQVENRLGTEETESAQHQAEYQLSFMQGLASLTALKARFGKDANLEYHPELRERMGEEAWGKFEGRYRDCEIILMEMHDTMVKEIRPLVQVTEQWLESIFEIWDYMRMLAESAPESALLARISNEWKELHDDIEHQLSERPPLE